MQYFHDFVRQPRADHGTFGGRKKHVIRQRNGFEEVFQVFVPAFGPSSTELIISSCPAPALQPV
jgi:hypothetical protein